MSKLAGSALAVVLLVLAASITLAEEKKVSVIGTPEDNFCWAAVDAHGASHKQCAIVCAKKGTGVSLVEKGSNKVYILMPAKNASPLPPALIDKMEDEVTVSGKEYSKNGVNYLTVESVH